MKKPRWQLAYVVGLLLVACGLFLLHYKIFRDWKQLTFYLALDTVFVPIQVLLVTLIIDSLLSRREKRVLLEKLNMVIGAFFSSVGTELLAKLSAAGTNLDSVRPLLVVRPSWSKKEFAALARRLQNYGFALDSRRADLESLRAFLNDKQAFLLGLLQNPNLLEHESFTRLLWAVLHLAEELAHRRSLRRLGASDYEHLAGDMLRAYQLLVLEWLAYMRHLQEHYPFLFSLALRTNPFDPQARVEIGKQAFGRPIYGRKAQNPTA